MRVAVRCLKCQCSIIACFIAPSRAVAPRPQISRNLSQVKIQRRHFRKLAALHSDKLDASLRDENTVGSERSGSGNAPPQNDVAQVPWYLQRRPATVESNPFAERQRIPDISSDSPKILSPLLNYISVELGLDYLTLLDLRKLNPPPALGANLLMIFGSVRSEKHLHVSADRLCRWLRSNFKLRPYADGLLGRNELKLKLKRKARRAKLLSSVSSTESLDHDDGIRTGWICVNIGAVESSESTDTSLDAASDQNFVGFGEGKDSIRIVVQMMTDEKREEMDLEGLWTAMLNRQSKKDMQLFGDQNADLENSPDHNLNAKSTPNPRNLRSTRLTTIFVEDDVPSFCVGKSLGSSETSPSTRSILSKPGPFRVTFTRSLHTQRRLPDPEMSSLEPTLLSHQNHLDAQHDTAEPTPRHPDEQRSNLIGQAVTLRTQLKYLGGLHRSTALSMLGDGDWDKSSTTFLQTFYGSFPTFPESEHWECMLELLSTAIILGHKGYCKSVLFQKLRESQISGFQVSENCYWSVLKAQLLGYHMLNEENTNPRISGVNAFRLSFSGGFRILEDMEHLGYQIVTDDLFLLLQEAISNPRFATPPLRPSKINSRPMTSLLNRIYTINPSELWPDYKITQHLKLGKLIDQLGFQPVLDQFFVRMLRSYADQGEWRLFWQTWNRIPKMKRRRTSEMYALLFNAEAQSGNQKACQTVLRHHIPEMATEDPPVVLEGILARSVRACLLASGAQLDTGEWADLWEQCNQASLEIASSK